MTDDPEFLLRRAEEKKWQRRCALRQLVIVGLAAAIVLGVIVLIVLIGYLA